MAGAASARGVTPARRRPDPEWLDLPQQDPGARQRGAAAATQGRGRGTEELGVQGRRGRAALDCRAGVVESRRSSPELATVAARRRERERRAGERDG